MKAGWDQKPLSDLASFRSGLWTGKKGPFTTAKVIRNTNIRKHGQLSFDDIAEIEVETKQLETRRLQHGDIILERSGGGPKQAVGRAVCFELEEKDFSFSNFTSVIRIQNRDRLAYRFLHLVLNWWYEAGVTERIQSNSTGIRNLDFNAYKELAVPLPPLEEQQRIVAVLDEAFEGLRRARANVEANLQNAWELFETFLSRLMASNSNEWTTYSFGDQNVLQIVDGDRGANYPKKTEFTADGHCLFLSTKNVRPDGFNFDDTMFISAERDQALRSGKLKPRDLILTTRGTIGNIAFFDETVPYEHIRINSGMLVLRPNENLVRAEFLFELLRSTVIKEQIAEHVSGAAQPQLPIRSLVKFDLPAPNSITEQLRIVDQLQFLGAEVAALEATYSRSLLDLDDLRQSLMHKAFAGELT